MLCCLRLTRIAKVAPINGQSKQYADLQPPVAYDSIPGAIAGVHTTLDGKTNQIFRPKPTATAADSLDQLLHNLLSAAGLVSASTANSSTSHEHQSPHHKIPKDLEQLNQQLITSCKIVAQSQDAVPSTAAELSGCLLQYIRQQQQQQWQTLPDISIPSADALMNIINMTVFAQVSLDSAAMLQCRYKQYSQVLLTLGLDNSRLAACVQPAGKALIACLMLGSKATAGEVKVPLVVRRHTCFWDALKELQQQGLMQNQQVSGAVQVAKLFPRFVDGQLLHEQQQQASSASRRLQPGVNSSSSSSTVASVPLEHGEGHGPRKEFFQLMGEALTRQWNQQEQPALFVHLRATNTWWFNTALTQTGQLRTAYQAVGWLLAQAIVNRCTVGLQLAPLLFCRLLQAPGTSFQPTLFMLEQHDPETAQGLKSVLQLPSQQFSNLLQIEGKPSGLTKQQYVEQAVQQLLVADVAWQYQALHEGFFAASDLQVLLDCCFTGACLTHAICGPATDPNTDFDIKHVYRISLEDDGNDACCSNSSVRLLLQCLWQVVDNWSPQQKRALVKFVTGSDRLPPPGSEQWIISFPFVAYGINKQHQLLGTLPQSHTCTNTLELPNYIEALIAMQPELAMKDEQEGSGTTSWGSSDRCWPLRERCCNIIQDRLLVAITSCDGYGLDEATAAPASTQQQLAAHVKIDNGSSNNKAAVPPVWHATSAAQHGVVPGAAAGAMSAASLPLAARQHEAEHKEKQLQQHDEVLAQTVVAPATHKVSTCELPRPRPQQPSYQQQKESEHHLSHRANQYCVPAQQQMDEYCTQKQQQAAQQGKHHSTLKMVPGRPKLLTDSDEDLLELILAERLVL